VKVSPTDRLREFGNLFVVVVFVVCFVEISCILFCWNLSASVADV